MMRLQNRPACGWTLVVLIGVVINLLVLVVTPVLRPDLNLLEKSLSYYAVGPWGALQMVAFGALGISSMALGIALRTASLQPRWEWPIVLLLVTSGLAGLGLVWYPMDAPGPATFLGDAHQTAGTIGGVTQLAAALAFAIAIRADPAWGHMFVTALAMFLLAVLGAILSQVSIWWPHLDIPMGATMRLLVVPLTILWGLVALRLRRTCA
jgi:hypothetical protein